VTRAPGWCVFPFSLARDVNSQNPATNRGETLRDCDAYQGRYVPARLSDGPNAAVCSVAGLYQLADRLGGVREQVLRAAGLVDKLCLRIDA